MNENQLRNIINFCFNFHSQCDVKFENQHPDYIIEKWNKYIGIKPISNFINDVSDNTDVDNWVKKWNLSPDTFLNVKEIAYLIISLNKRPLIGKIHNDEKWELDTIMEEFSKFINVNSVNSDFYNHIHFKLKKEIDYFLDRLENSRYFKLSLLLN